MNPFDEHRRIYITVCFTVAVIYALALGGIFHVSSPIVDALLFRFADGLIYGVILYLTGIILWNIFRYAIPTNYNPKYRLIFVFGLAVFAGIFVVATESLAIFLCFPSLFEIFALSIPARLFVTLLLIIIIRLFYVFNNEKHKRNGEWSEDMTEDSFPSGIIKKENEVSENVSLEKTFPIEPSSNTGKPSIDRITVRTGQKITIIPINEIIFIKADGDYISISTSKGNWLKEQTMKYTEDTLPVDLFVRIHRSYIVNVNHISRIERYGEKQLIVLHNNEKIKISSARFQVLKRVLEL